MLNQFFFADNSLNFLFTVLIITFIVAYLICFKLMGRESILEMIFLWGFLIIFLIAATGIGNATLFALAILMIAFVVFYQFKRN